jgi:hypothetical protein
MRRLILKMSMSLDGFVGGLNGEIDWLFRNLDEGATAWIADTRPTSTEPLAALMNDIPKVVFTRQRSLDLAAGRTTTALRDANQALEASGYSSILLRWALDCPSSRTCRSLWI